MKISFVRNTLCVASLALPATLFASTQHPKNLGNGLDQVVARELAAKAGQTLGAPGVGSAVDAGDRAIHDADGRILVTVYLRNPAGRDSVAKLKDVKIDAEEMTYQGGALSAYVPAERVADLATAKGVSSVFLALKPIFNVGRVTTQGVHQHRVDQITNQKVSPVTGFTGAGITVGVMSDSFNTSSGPIKEAQDIASGDLPGPGNPNNPDPVLVLEELPEHADEGRAMCQIVFDMAPAAKLIFSTTTENDVGFAENLRAVAAAGANVMVDDVYYFEEGMFQDTLSARVVDELAQSGISYFSAAGNTPATQGYYSDFRLVPNNGNATNGTNINLAGVPPELYAGGFHDFNPEPSQQDIAQSVLIGNSSAGTDPAIFDFQWDDPYDVNLIVGDNIVRGTGNVPPGGSDDFTFPGTEGERVQISVSANPATPDFDAVVEIIAPDGTSLITQDTGTDEILLITLPQSGTYIVRVTSFLTEGGTYDYSVDEAVGPQLVSTDFNMLFFNGDGAFIGALGLDNITANRPIEIAQIFPSQTTAGNIVQVVIARSNTPPPTPQPASKLKYVCFTSGEPQEYFSYNRTPITFGHSAAAGAMGVGAYAFYPPYIPEGFTSPGPSIIAFDHDNNRLPQPEVRKKPDISAMDGANTTFFVSDAAQDRDFFPNFFGTSAAAPHAAAIAALVLQAHGGPGSVTPTQMRSVLQRSTFRHDLDPYRATARARSGDSTISLQIMSDARSLLSVLASSNAFHVRFTGSGSLTQLILNPQGTDATGGNTTEPFSDMVGFTSRPGLVFDNRSPEVGLPFTLGELKGVQASDITATLSNQAPPPALVGNHFYTLSIEINPGALTTREGFDFGIDRDEADAYGPSGTVGGNSADLLGANVLIPEGKLASGGMTFGGATSNGPFSGIFVNQIGKGYSTLDGYGFINAEAAVREPLE